MPVAAAVTTTPTPTAATTTRTTMGPPTTHPLQDNPHTLPHQDSHPAPLHPASARELICILSVLDVEAMNILCSSAYRQCVY